MKQTTGEIAELVRKSLDRYFRDLDGAKPRSIYDMVLKNVEKPMLEAVLDRAEGNQTIAAQMLGINRNTLRKKIHEHKIKP
jgi:Fis family transcriptional regulator